MTAQTYDNRLCTLGEGPIWHPERQQFFWFDIMGKRLLSRDGDTPLEWAFDEHVSSAGWVTKSEFLIASETALFRFNLDTGARANLCALEADNPVTRSNDGRADPWGGFWIGTMGKHAEAKAGTIYRYFRKELRPIAGDITVTNSICFSPDRRFAFYTDTPTRLVMRVPLDPVTGWPAGEAEVFLDQRDSGLNPDGAVTDAAGNLWIAEWGAAQVSCYSPEGTCLSHHPVPALQSSCPAFGGRDRTNLYVTSANVGLSEEEMSNRPLNGATFVIPDVGQGRSEYRVIL